MQPTDYSDGIVRNSYSETSASNVLVHACTGGLAGKAILGVYHESNIPRVKVLVPIVQANNCPPTLQVVNCLR